MAGGRTSRRKRTTSVSAVGRRQVPWLMVGGVAVVVVAAVLLIGIPLTQRGLTPSDGNRDPSLDIPGVRAQQYGGGQHVRPDQRVAYTNSPPFGGAHDNYWAACNGVVYPTPVRVENLVHSLEHGAVWIAYDPDRITGEALDTLRAKVDGRSAMVMSPYPGLDSPISLQSWGHQLKLAAADDERIDQFVQALRLNRFTHPEVGASCAASGPGGFDQDAPPRFEPVPPRSAVDNQTVVPEDLGGSSSVVPDVPAPADGR